jgi:hypothetical protein
VTKYIAGKSAAAVILFLLTAGVGKTLTQARGPHHSRQSILADQGGGNPDPTGGDGPPVAALHLS